MERNTLTTAHNLQIGDRFYKATDRKKQVLEMVQYGTKTTHFRTYKHWYKDSSTAWPKPINSDTQVIFLRNANDTATQPAEQHTEAS